MTQAEQVGPEDFQEEGPAAESTEQTEPDQEKPEPEPEAEDPAAASLREQAEKAAEEKRNPEPVVVSREDLLTAANLNLHQANAQLKVQLKQAELKDAIHAQSDVQRSMADLQAELEKKYGIDLRTHTIRDSDGVVIPRVPSLQA